MKKTEGKKNGKVSKNRGRCSLSRNLMQMNVYRRKSRLEPNLSNPETPVLELPSCSIVVASYLFHPYKIIPSV